MCVGDIRFASRIRSVPGSALVSAVPSIMLPPNRDRVGILFAAHTTATLSYSVGAIADGAVFVSMVLSSGGFFLNMLEHGDLPTKEIGVAASGAVTASFVEFILPSEMVNKLQEPWTDFA